MKESTRNDIISDLEGAIRMVRDLPSDPSARQLESIQNYTYGVTDTLTRLADGEEDEDDA